MTSRPASFGRAASTSRDRLLGLLARRHQRGAVGERPAVVLRVRHFEPARAELKREVDERADLMKVRADG